MLSQRCIFTLKNELWKGSLKLFIICACILNGYQQHRHTRSARRSSVNDWHKETFNISKLKMAYLKKCLFTFWDSGSVLMQQEEGCLLNQQQDFLCTETRGSTWGSSFLVLTFCSAFVRNEVTVSRASWHSCVCISDCSSKNICRCFWERMCFSFQCESPYQCVSMWGVSGDCLAGELYRKNLHHSLSRREIYDRWVRYKYLNSTSLNG